MSTSKIERLEERIRTALSHLAVDDAEQAERVLRTALNLPADLETAPVRTVEPAQHLMKLADACARGVKAWSHMEESGRVVVADALLTAASELSARRTMNALFEHCTVTLWPSYSHGSSSFHYAIEHNPAQEKDERRRIETELQVRLSWESEPAVSEAPAP